MLNILKKAAHEAGDALLKHFYKGVSPSYKGSHHNLLTEADLACQEIIQSSIIKSMVKKGYKKKEIGFIGEENLNVPGRYKFIIDPIDGTNNFSSGIDYFCVSIGFARDGNLTTGLIYQPTDNTYFVGEKNNGAYIIKNNIRKRLQLKPFSLKDCIVASYIHDDKNFRQREFALLQKLFDHIRSIRIYAALALDICNLALNQLQIVFTLKYHIWDAAAAKIIIEESGGEFVSWQGKKTVFNINKPDETYSLISCHPQILSKIIKIVNK